MKAFLVQNNDLQFLELDDMESLRQRIKHRLSLFLGEWKLSETDGINWFEVLGSRTANESDIEILIRDEMLKDSEIISVDSMDVKLIKTNEQSIRDLKPLRQASVEYSATSIYGQLVGSI